MTHWRAIFLIWFLCVVVWVPMLFPPSHWYELRSVRIEDSVVGTPSRIGADRTIRRNFLGSYSVRILAFPSNDLVCVAGPFEPFPYRKTDTPLENKDLAWWLRDRDAFEACEEQGMTAGQYVAVTNHTILNPWRFVPWVDVITTPDIASNVFTIFATEGPPVDQLIEQQGQIESLEKQIEDVSRGLTGLRSE